jgi:hypothetical protein
MPLSFHKVLLGRQHPKEPDPGRYGHSIGHWDGDTLVVDRVNFEEQVWLDQEAHPHSDKLRSCIFAQRAKLRALFEIDIDPHHLAGGYRGTFLSESQDPGQRR